MSMNYHAIVANRDRVDRDLEIWARELPELDLPTEALVSRIWMLAKHFDSEPSDGRGPGPYTSGGRRRSPIPPSP